MRKELTDIRRQLADSNFEKEKYHNSNKELRDHIKKVESEKRDIGRQLEEAFQKITCKFYIRSLYLITKQADFYEKVIFIIFCYKLMCGLYFFST